MTSIRCKKCGRLLMKGEEVMAEIKCPKCGHVQTVRHATKKTVDILGTKAENMNIKPGILDAAHEHCIRNRDEIRKSAVCGCFYCGAIFDPETITQWIDGDQTAMCPECEIDAVLGSASGLPIQGLFLAQMHDYWFSA